MKQVFSLSLLSQTIDYGRGFSLSLLLQTVKCDRDLLIA